MSGTTTYFGVTYPTSTDYVKDGATAIQTVATGFDSAVAIPTYNAQTGATYTFALTDIGKTVTSSNASAQTYTIPPTASVAWPTNTTLNVVNLGAGTVTFAAGAGVTVTNTAATLSQYQSAALVRTALNAWTVIPFAGGAALLTDSAISGTTGSPTTTTFSSGGFNYKAYAFTGSGTITFSKAGLIDVLCIAGGAGGGTKTGGTSAETGGGGGAGGYMNSISTETSGNAQTLNSLYIATGTKTVTIGAGGAGNANGTFSLLDYFVTFGGGKGGGTITGSQQPASLGGSGGGGYGGSAGATGISYQGSTGGSSSIDTNGGGGGGANAVGSNGATTTGGAGGAGLTSSINGTAVARGGGGGGAGTVTGGTATAGGGAGSNSGVGTAGTVNTGGGGGGGRGSSTGGAGGSGIVIVRVLA